MDRVNIDTEKFSFREKLSFITNSSEYGKVAHKLWAICRLITSCGRCALPITKGACHDIINNQSTNKSIFSRKVQRLLDYVNKELVEHSQMYVSAVNTNSSDDKSGDAALRIIDQRMAELRYEVSGKNTFENEKYHVDIMMKGLVNTFNDLHDSGSQMFKDCLYLRVLTEVKTQLVAKNAPD